MKKLSKNNLLLIVLGVLIVVLANLSAAHSRQVSGQTQLIDELALAKVRLGKIQLEQLGAQIEQKQEKLNALLFEIESARKMLDEPVTSIETSDMLLKIAGFSGVKLASLSSSGVNPEDLGGLPASALVLDLRVEGYLPGILDFIRYVDSAIPTGYIKIIEIANTPGSDISLANMVVAIYTDRGS